LEACEVEAGGSGPVDLAKHSGFGDVGGSGDVDDAVFAGGEEDPGEDLALGLGPQQGKQRRRGNLHKVEYITRIMQDAGLG